MDAQEPRLAVRQGRGEVYELILVNCVVVMLGDEGVLGRDELRAAAVLRVLVLSSSSVRLVREVLVSKTKKNFVV